MDVSVKVTSIVRCKFTSFESCKMSGWGGGGVEGRNRDSMKANAHIKVTEQQTQAQGGKTESGLHLQQLQELAAKPEEIFHLLDPEEREIL